MTGCGAGWGAGSSDGVFPPSRLRKSSMINTAKRDEEVPRARATDSNSPFVDALTAAPIVGTDPPEKNDRGGPSLNRYAAGSNSKVLDCSWFDLGQDRLSS